MTKKAKKDPKKWTRAKQLSKIPDMSRGADLGDLKKELTMLSECSRVQALPAYNKLCTLAIEESNVEAVDMIASFRGPHHLFRRACKDDNKVIVDFLLSKMERPLSTVFLENLALGSSTKMLTHLEEYYSPDDFGKALGFCVLGRSTMNDDVFEFFYKRSPQKFLDELHKITQKDKDPSGPVKKFRARLKSDKERALLKDATDKGSPTSARKKKTRL